MEDKKLKFNELDLDGAKKQEVLGFGGALTDAALISFNSLDSKTRERLEQAWFGDVGVRVLDFLLTFLLRNLKFLREHTR